MTEEYLRYGHRLEPHIADTAQLCWEALDAGRTVLFEGAQGDHARPRPRHLSLRHLVEPGRRRRLRRRRASAPATSTRSGGSPRPTRPGSGAGRSRPSSTTSSATQIRERGGECGTTTGRDAPLRLARPGRAALRGAAQRPHAPGRHQARCARRHRPAPGRGPLPLREGAVFDEFPYHQSILHAAERRVRGAAGLRGRHRRLPQRGRAAPRRGTTSLRSREQTRVPSAWWAWARAASR